MLYQCKTTLHVYTLCHISVRLYYMCIAPVSILRNGTGAIQIHYYYYYYILLV